MFSSVCSPAALALSSMFPAGFWTVSGLQTSFLVSKFTLNEGWDFGFQEFGR
jgi:hypothetical protein